MANNIDYLISRVKLRIPDQILTHAFSRFTKGGLRSIDSAIFEQVISPIVIKDCNLFAGKLKKVQLRDEWREYAEQPSNMIVDHYTVFRIPPEARDNENIIYVLDIDVDVNSSIESMLPLAGQSTFGGLAREALYSYTGQNQIPIPRVTLYDGNVVQLSHANSYGRRWILSCLIGYDQGFSNVVPSMLDVLANMCVYSTRAFIYNLLVIEIGQGMLTLGKELAPFKDLIDSYADAYEKYEEAKLEFRGAANFDKETWPKMMGLIL